MARYRSRLLARPLKGFYDLIAILNCLAERIAMIAAGKSHGGFVFEKDNLAKLLLGFAADNVQQKCGLRIYLDGFGGQYIKAKARVILHPAAHVVFQALRFAKFIHAHAQSGLLPVLRNWGFINGNQRGDILRW